MRPKKQILATHSIERRPSDTRQVSGPARKGEMATLADSFLADLQDLSDDEDADVYPGAPGLDDDCELIVADDTGAMDDTGSMDDPGDDTDTGDDGSDSDGGIAAGDGEDLKGDAAGCACSSGSMAASTPWLAALALFGLVRRRQD